MENEGKREAVALACMTADAEFVAPGSTFDHTCAICEARLMLAPSGLEFLKAHPGAVTVCVNCIRADDECLGLAAPIETVIREARSAVPNLRRTRN